MTEPRTVASHPARSLTAALAAAALLLGTGGCTVAEADLDFPRVCFTDAFTVPGLPIGAVSVTAPFVLDLSGVPLLQDETVTPTEVFVQTVTLTPTSGAPDLSGITSAEMALAATDEVLARYTADGTAPTSIVLQGTDVNAAAQLAAGRIPLQVSLAGAPPPTAWSGTLETCVRGKTHVEY